MWSDVGTGEEIHRVFVPFHGRFNHTLQLNNEAV